MLKAADLRRAALDLAGHLAQRRCRACLAPYPPAEHPAGACGICPACLAALPPRPAVFCRMCGDFFVREAGLCADCLARPKPWGRVYFWGAYRGGLREFILRVKFNGDIPLAEGLGALLALHPDLPRREVPYDRVVPVPLHPRRQGERGFNQALEIARPLAALLRVPLYAAGIRRTGDTCSQSRLTRRERAENLRRAFTVTESWSGRRVLLADDVLTTGATAWAVSTCLLEAGACSVDVAVPARTPARNMGAALK